MKIAVVDEHDSILCLKERDELVPSDIYRVTGLWLTNIQGDALVARRALTKKNSPGLWGPAVAGTVEGDETYDTNIVKEIREEIGIAVQLHELKRGPKIFVSEPGRRYFGQWYFYTANIPLDDFVVSKEDVAELRWVDKNELAQWYANRPEEFLPSTNQWLPAVLPYSDATLEGSAG